MTRLWSLAAATVVLSGCTVLGGQEGDGSAQGGDVTAARTHLAHLTIMAPISHHYNRTADFGAAWSYDFDHNGCRTRDDILRRDLTNVMPATGCRVVSGVLADPYTGETIHWTRTRASQVQIDHVYPLHAAVEHGAATWSPRRRLEFANDPGELIAASGTANSAKGDRTPAEWRPADRRVWCGYAVRYIAVASRYGLSISRADLGALNAMLGGCPRRDASSSPDEHPRREGR